MSSQRKSMMFPRRLWHFLPLFVILWISLLHLVNAEKSTPYIPYGTRLSSSTQQKAAASQLHNVTIIPSENAPKEQKFVHLKRAQISSYQLPTVSFSRPSSHYEVDLSSSNVSSPSDSATKLDEILPELSHKNNSQLDKNALVLSSIAKSSSNNNLQTSSLDNPLASSSETVHINTESGNHLNIHTSPLYQSDYRHLEPILLNIAARQHPGNIDAPGNRRPFMVESSNVQQYFTQHLPPLTAALPMGFFEGERGLYSSDLTGTSGSNGHQPLVNSYSADLEVLDEPTNHLTGPVEIAAVERPSRASLPAVSNGDANNRGYGPLIPLSGREMGYVPGIPGHSWKDYPMFAEVPKTSFSCAHTSYGYYADVESGCQAWYYCQPDGRQNAFLCPNGTVFNQKTRVCDWWYNVHCASSRELYGLNADLYKPHLAPKPIHLHAQPRSISSRALLYRENHTPHIITPRAISFSSQPHHFSRYRSEYEMNSSNRHELESSA